METRSQLQTLVKLLERKRASIKALMAIATSSLEIMVCRRLNLITNSPVIKITGSHSGSMLFKVDDGLKMLRLTP